LIILGGNENVAQYFSLCCWYIYSTGEPDRPIAISDLNTEFASQWKAPEGGLGDQSRAGPEQVGEADTLRSMGSMFRPFLMSYDVDKLCN
jgi:hypothetical protein